MGNCCVWFGLIVVGENSIINSVVVDSIRIQDRYWLRAINWSNKWVHGRGKMNKFLAKIGIYEMAVLFAEISKMVIIKFVLNKGGPFWPIWPPHGKKTNFLLLRGRFKYSHSPFQSHYYVILSYKSPLLTPIVIVTLPLMCTLASKCELSARFLPRTMTFLPVVWYTRPPPKTPFP